MKYIRILFLVLGIFSFSALSALLMSGCDRSEPALTLSPLPGEDPDPDPDPSDTRLTMDNIAISRDLTEGDVFRLLVYRLTSSGGQLYASAVCTVGSGRTVSFSTTYASATTVRTGLYLPTGDYRLCVYMTPETAADLTAARLAVSAANRTLTFERGTDLLMATRDINIPRRTDTNEHTVVVSWNDVVFKHQSSKINFRIEHKTPTHPDEKSTDPITVRKIVVSNLNPQGISTLSLLEGDPAAAVSAVPVDATNRTGKVELAHQADNTNYQFTSAYDGVYPVVTTYPFLMIPQENLANILIKITLQTDLLGEEEWTLSAVSQTATYLPNTAYTFTLQIDKERPVLLCTVEPWYEGTDDNQDNSADDIEDDGDFNPVTPGFMVEGWEINNSSNENNVGQE